MKNGKSIDNTTYNCIHEEEYRTALALSLLIMITIIFTNSLLLAILKYRKWKISILPALLSLVLSKLLMGLTVLPIAASYAALRHNYVAQTSVLCIVCGFCFNVLQTCHVVSYTVLAFDGYMAVTSRTYRNFPTECKSSISVLIWFVAMVMHVLLVSTKTGKYKYDCQIGICTIAFTTVHAIVLFITAHAVPLLTCVIFMIATLRDGRKKLCTVIPNDSLTSCKVLFNKSKCVEPKGSTDIECANITKTTADGNPGMMNKVENNTTSDIFSNRYESTHMSEICPELDRSIPKGHGCDIAKDKDNITNAITKSYFENHTVNLDKDKDCDAVTSDTPMSVGLKCVLSKPEDISTTYVGQTASYGISEDTTNASIDVVKAQTEGVKCPIDKNNAGKTMIAGKPTSERSLKCVLGTGTEKYSGTSTSEKAKAEGIKCDFDFDNDCDSDTIECIELPNEEKKCNDRSFKENSDFVSNEKTASSRDIQNIKNCVSHAYTNLISLIIHILLWCPFYGASLYTASFKVDLEAVVRFICLWLGLISLNVDVLIYSTFHVIVKRNCKGLLKKLVS